MTAGQLRAELQAGHWLIQGDVDGNGTADLAILVFRADAGSMIAADFLL